MSQLVDVRTDRELERFAGVGGQEMSIADALASQRPDALLLLEGPGGPTARCALRWHGTATHAGRPIGAIGHYYAADADAGTRLLELACGRLAGENCHLAVGPLDGNTWRRYRLITQRGPEPPFFLEPDHPDEWPGHFIGAGFTALARYHSSLASDLFGGDPRAARAAQRFEAGSGSVREFRMDDFDEEVRRIHALSLVSFRDNFLFTPLSLQEFQAQCAKLKQYLQPELILLAEREGELAGFVFAVPDLLQARRGQRVDTVVIKTLAVHPDHRGSGLGSILTDLCHRSAARLGYRRAVHALMHDTNPSARISARNAHVFRRYVLFARPLTAGAL